MARRQLTSGQRLGKQVSEAVFEQLAGSTSADPRAARVAPVVSPPLGRRDGGLMRPTGRATDTA